MRSFLPTRSRLMAVVLAALSLAMQALPVLADGGTIPFLSLIHI